MKRWLFVTAILTVFAAGLIWAAAPAPHNYATTTMVDTLTTTSPYGGSKWYNFGTITYTSTDSSVMILRANGIAIGEPGSKLYMGFSTDSSTAPNHDTVLVEFPRVLQQGELVRMPFMFDYPITRHDSTDLVQPIYLLMAIGASSKSDVVYLYDVSLLGKIDNK